MLLRISGVQRVGMIGILRPPFVEFGSLGIGLWSIDFLDSHRRVDDDAVGLEAKCVACTTLVAGKFHDNAVAHHRAGGIAKAICGDNPSRNDTAVAVLRSLRETAQDVLQGDGSRDCKLLRRRAAGMLASHWQKGFATYVAGKQGRYSP